MLQLLQKDKITVQGEIENALKIITNTKESNKKQKKYRRKNKNKKKKNKKKR